MEKGEQPMVSKNEERAKPTRSFTLTPKAIALLDQLHKESGMNKSEIINKLIIDYFDSLRKKIVL